MPRLALPLLASLLLALPARAVVHTILEDGFDDRQLVLAAQKDSDVVESGKIMEELKARLRKLKKPGFAELFGEPVPYPEKTYALPVCEPRAVGLPGIRHADEAKNKDHWAFYAVGDESGVQVYFGLDGETPGLVLFRFRPNRLFPKLTKDNLGNRVSWDLDRYERLRAFCDPPADPEELGLNEEWLGRDRKLLARVRKLLPPAGELDPFLKRFGCARDEVRDIGFGARRAHDSKGGGYGSFRLRVLAFEGKLAAVDLRYEATLDSWRCLKGAALPAWGKQITPLPDGFRYRWSDPARLELLRKARAKELGEPHQAAIPADLRGALDTLTAPLRFYDFGTTCYYAGVPPEGRKAVDKLAQAGRADLLQMALLGPNPEGRVYAAEALLKLDADAPRLPGRTRAIIAKVRALKIPISVCQGCLVSSQPAARLLPE